MKIFAAISCGVLFLILLGGCDSNPIPLTQTSELAPTQASTSAVYLSQTTSSTQTTSATPSYPPPPGGVSDTAQPGETPVSSPGQSCGPPEGWVSYTVQAGDNLFRLSRELGLTVAQLQSANCLGSSILIRAGDQLYVPVLPAGPTVTPALIQPTLPDESILILQPASGSRLTSPLTITGMADPTFEQTLVVRMLLDDGTQIALLPTIIQAELGQRGAFEVELEFEVSGERQAFIQVFTQSARDGQITHLAAVGITLSDTGPADIRTSERWSEQIHILKPSPGELITGGVISIEGFGWAGFENTLVVELQDENGKVIGLAPVTIESPEMGHSGPFRAQIPYTTTTEGHGRVVVRDVSPAFGGDIHVSSVEIKLAP
jgi:LysM repeat protein